MILSSSASQPYALMVFSLLGAGFGLVYIQNYFLSSFLIKKALFGHILNVLYVLLYLLCFVLCEYCLFDYDLHVYHYLIAVSMTFAFAFAVYLPISKYRDNIDAKCDKFIAKIKDGKLYKRITK